MDLNDVAVFEKVAAFRSFTHAARTLGLPKSSISRAIARLESALDVRLFERGTRSVLLTAAGEVLRSRCKDGLTQIKEALESASGLASTPRGALRVSAGMGFGLNILGVQLPGFLQRFPQVSVSVNLTSQQIDLVSEGVDVAIRMGPLQDSALAATRLGQMSRYLCVAPAYIARRGCPRSLKELNGHDTIEMPSPTGRPRTWSFTRNGATESVDVQPKISSNEALLVVRLIHEGCGIGIISGYLCAEAIESGKLEMLLPEWTAPPVDVSLVFPSRLKMPPTVRAFVNYMREMNGANVFWKREPLLSGSTRLKHVQLKRRRR